MWHEYFCRLAFVVIIATAATADASPSINLFISSQNQGFYYASASAFLVPADFAVPFTTGRISTPDNQHVLNFEGFWKPQFPLPTFSTPTELITSINQPWQILLDEGLSSERRYTTSLNVAGLQSTDISAPQITYPTSQSMIGTLTPTFTFTNLRDGSGMRLELIGSGDLPVALETLSGPSASWSPPTPLVPGEYYLNISRSLLIPDLAFTAPVDQLGNGILDWQSQSLVQTESSRFFTIVPEPAGFTILVTALFLLPRRRPQNSMRTGR
jgi:hypothetical protein